MTRDELQELLQRELPHRLVRRFGNTIQVRAGKFTLNNVDVMFDVHTQSARLRSMLDLWVIFLVCFTPVAIYMFIHRAQYRASKEEVITILKKHQVTINPT